MSDNLEMPKTFAELEAYTSSILASQQSAHDAEIARLKWQVAMLQNIVFSSLHAKDENQKHIYAASARAALSNTQAIAEAFISECEQRWAVKALEDAANWFILRGPDGTSIDGDAESAESLRKMARDIRATSKKAG